MTGVMNAIAHASPAPLRGPKLDNRRVLAGVVDLVIVALGAAVVLFAGDALSVGEVKGALGVVILGWALYYFFALESGDGQTVGKKLMKLRVVREDGSPAGMREIAVRTILRVIDNYLVGLIVMLATGERRQRIGDLAAGTVVVDATGSAPVAAAPAADVAVADEVEDDAVEEPVGEEPVGEEPVEEEPVEEEPVEEEPVEAVENDAPAATATITLPSRPAPPATLSDLAAPNVAEQAAAEEPVADEPVAEQPVAEHTPPEITSPSIEELVRDVQAAQAEPGPVEVPEVEPVEAVEASEAVEPDVAQDEPVNVKSVETVSAIDLIMGGGAEEPGSEDEGEAEGPASA
jgi:uncharacterized RDD family membrane protein YckC